MATGTAALAQKLTSKKSANNKPSSSVKKSSEKKPGGPSKSRSDVPWLQIQELYNKGLSVAEISDKLKLTRLKTKKGKENPYPYYLVVGYLTKLSHGVEADGKKFSIVRGAKNKKRATSKSK